MKKITSNLLLIILFLTILIPLKAINGPGVYGGGSFYYNREYAYDELRESGFRWVCIWTIHIMNAEGDLNYNAEFPIVEDGTFIGNKTYPKFPNDVAMLKTEPTTIEWIEIGLSAWESATFDHIKTLVESEGTGPESTLYRNFKALKEAIPAIDAISFDDEKTYHEPSTTQFAIMLADLGYKVSICPYNQVSHWQLVVENVNKARPGTIEDVHLQCYAGGSKNDLCQWDTCFDSDINVMPGVEDGNDIATRLAPWNDKCGMTGAWLWLYDDFKNNPGLVKKYARTIDENITQLPKKSAETPSKLKGGCKKVN